MEKLVEREPGAARHPLVAAPALAVQFFLIPLAVVGIAVSVYVGFRTLLADDRKPQDYLQEIRFGGSTRRWPAAYELSRLMADPKVRSDRTLAPALVKAFEDSKDDAQVRRYLALAIGRLDPPLSTDAVGALPGDAQTDTLRTALNDGTADVRWNAAVALARHGSREGEPVVKQMLDRPYVEHAVTREVRQDADQDPVADVMISGLRAVAVLKDKGLKPTVTALSQH